MANPPVPPKATVPPKPTGGSRIPAVVTQKVGPLPLWAWVVAAGVAFYFYQSRHSSSSGGSTDTATTDANPVPASIPSSGFSGTGGQGGIGGQIPPGTVENNGGNPQGSQNSQGGGQQGDPAAGQTVYAAENQQVNPGGGKPQLVV